MPTISATKPDLDVDLPVALAARIAGIDRVALADLLDHRLLPGTAVDTVRALGSSGTLRLARSDEESPLVLRLDPARTSDPVGDLDDEQLLDAISGPHRVSPTVAGRQIVVTVRGFVIAHGVITGTDEPGPIGQDRRGRDIIARRLRVRLDGRLKDLSVRPSKVKGEDRWLGRRTATTAGGSLVELAVS